MRKIILPFKSEKIKGRYVVRCPSLPCCISEGKTKQTALRNMKKAAGQHLNLLAEAGLPLVDGICY